MSFGPFALRWYSVMYVVGYVLGYWLVLKRAATGRARMTRADLDNLIWFLAAGMIIGARVVYVLVYGREEYAAHPAQIFAVWQGGLSFHGAIAGMTVALALFVKRYQYSFLELADLITVCGTFGLFFGRLGNFINAELYGRPTNVPWAMIFPTDPQHLPRHPSQLYEAIAEGLILGSLLWWIDSVARARGFYRPGLITSCFVIGYAIIRFSLEFVRQPDAQLGLVIGGLSMGQILSTLMLVIGLALLGAIYLRDARPASSM